MNKQFLVSIAVVVLMAVFFGAALLNSGVLCKRETAAPVRV